MSFSKHFGTSDALWINRKFWFNYQRINDMNGMDIININEYKFNSVLYGVEENT